VTDERAPIEHVLDVVVYAPLGLIGTVQKRMPDLVAEGRRSAEQRIVLARFIGQMAVGIAGKEVTRRLQSLRPAAQPGAVIEASATETAGPDDAGDASSVTSDRSTDDAPAAQVTIPVPTVDELPIPGYDSLAAAQVVGRLDALDPDELDRVAAYETAHRHRRTILAKVAQLRGHAV
jgi:hypothetical protein